MNYNAIFEWKMSPQEVEAYSLACSYENIFLKMFKDVADGTMIRKNSLPKKGDPRKSNLFRHCWKLRRETKGLLESNEYNNYLKANLTILKVHNARIEPNAICGDKAWVRYKVWKRHYDKKLADAGVAPPPPSITTTSPKLIAEIDRTKKFLFEKCDGEPTFDKIQEFIKSGKFKLWMAMGKVSMYYLVMSPFIEKSGAGDALFAVGTNSRGTINDKITNEVKDYFRHEFRYEFSL